jgi:hypothetical protein
MSLIALERSVLHAELLENSILRARYRTDCACYRTDSALDGPPAPPQSGDGWGYSWTNRPFQPSVGLKLSTAQMRPLFNHLVGAGEEAHEI